VARDAAGGVGGVEQEMKGWKTSAAVVILIILAVVTSTARDAGWWPGLFLVAALAVVVWRAAYDMGYKDGQRDLVDPPHLRPLTDDQRNTMLMRATLSPWRRWLGWAAIGIPGLMFWVFMYAAIHYGGGSGWAFFLAFVLSLVLLVVGVWLMEWFWRPFRAVQNEARRARAEKK